MFKSKQQEENGTAMHMSVSMCICPCALLLLSCLVLPYTGKFIRQDGRKAGRLAKSLPAFLFAKEKT